MSNSGDSELASLSSELGESSGRFSFQIEDYLNGNWNLQALLGLTGDSRLRIRRCNSSVQDIKPLLVLINADMHSSREYGNSCCCQRPLLLCENTSRQQAMPPNNQDYGLKKFSFITTLFDDGILFYFIFLQQEANFTISFKILQEV